MAGSKRRTRFATGFRVPLIHSTWARGLFHTAGRTKSARTGSTVRAAGPSRSLDNDMNRKTSLAIIGAFLAVLFFLLLFFSQVRYQEVAVVTRFGRVNREKKQPGLYFRLPWGIEMVHKLDQRVQNFEDKPMEGQTRDSYSLIMSVYVGWQITNPGIFFPRYAGYAEPIPAAERDLE